MITKQISILAAIAIMLANAGVIETDLTDFPAAEMINGQWRITEYIDAALTKGIEYDWREVAVYVQKHNAKYLNEVITFSSQTILRYYPDNVETAYHESIYPEAFYTYRIPHTFHIATPFYCYEIDHTDFKQWLVLFIDSDGCVYIKIDGYFYLLEKVEGEEAASDLQTN